jgi:hypothetical protein
MSLESFGFVHPVGVLKITHPLCCKGIAVDFYSFTLCTAALHHFELVQYPV